MKTFISLLLLLLPFIGITQNEQKFLDQAAKYEASLNEAEAMNAYRQVLKINSNHYQALWKLSELYSRVGNRQPTTAQKQQYFRTGKVYAQQAIKVNPTAADGYYALAVAMGRLALAESTTKNKIDAVKDIRTNAEKALKYNPDHGRAWHVLGKWHYEVANLNFFERTAVKVMYGGFEPASMEESIKAYEKAKQLEPEFALNYLELAKAYKSNGQKAKAIQTLKQLAVTPEKTADDKKTKEEGNKLLKQLTG
jgi:tetratricopeptide (TPR) repeat protein